VPFHSISEESDGEPDKGREKGRSKHQSDLVVHTDTLARGVPKRCRDIPMTNRFGKFQLKSWKQAVQLVLTVVAGPKSAVFDVPTA